LLAVGAQRVIQAQQSRPTRLNGADIAEIQQLYYRYAHGFDQGDRKMVPAVFTPDAEYTLFIPASSPRKMVGKALEEFVIGGGGKGPTNVVHIVGVPMIEPHPDGARGLAMNINVKIEKPSPQGGAVATGNSITLGGIYEDVFVRTPEGWRIKTRVFRLAHSVPGPAPAP
jgi:hypothetical protein